MKKVLLFIMICIAIQTIVHAQVILTLQLPPAGLNVKNQLWNFSLINTATATKEVRVEVIITELSTNQRVLSGTSRSFQLSKGVKQVQYSDVLPVVYNANTAYGIDNSPDGFLPVGVFSVCYNVQEIVSDVSEQIASECETVEVEPISPPILVIPVDSERIDMAQPFFSWIPPSPFSLFNNLQYDWILVEVLPTQTAATAAQQNIPVWSQLNITSPTYQYPLAAPTLDSAKLYAWQVTAKNNLAAVGKSEVWTFRRTQFGADTSAYKKTGFYTKLKRESESYYAICDGIFRFEYFNEINDTNVAVKVFDITSARAVEVFHDEAVSVQFGGNFMKWEAEEVSGITDRHLYLLELTNSKKEKWMAKFEYRQLNN